MTDSSRPRRDLTQPSQAQTGISDSAALLELSSILNSSQELEFILGNVLLTAMGKLLVSRAVVLVEQTQWTYTVRATKGIPVSMIDRSFTLAVDWSGTHLVSDIDGDDDAQVASFAQCCRDCGVYALIPMILKDRMVGIVGVGPKITGQPYSHADTVFLESIAAVAASAVHNALTIGALQGMNRRLDTKVQEMNTLFELSREMNETFDTQKILRVLGYALMGQMRAMRYAVFSIDGSPIRPRRLKLPDADAGAREVDKL
ncbi:MAG: hypothetical protein IPP94_04030 [Ignavibacteria bacterium]|nr:hypothetical protein [Ignavibacteria bacterium]